MKKTALVYVGHEPDGPAMPAAPKHNAGDVVVYRRGPYPKLKGKIVRIEAYWHGRGADPTIAYVVDGAPTKSGTTPVLDWQIIKGDARSGHQ